MITLYTTGCPLCNRIEEALERKNIEYTKVTGEEAVKTVLSLGYKQIPLLIVDDKPLTYAEAKDWIGEQ